MKDLVILTGAPGSGKSTIAELLREKEGFPLIDFGWLRQGHLDNKWSNATPKEKQMAFENLIFIVNNYWKHGYKNIIVNDLDNDKVIALADVCKEKDYIIISLVIDDDEELKKRVLGERDSGFKDVEAAVAWNDVLKSRPSIPHEHKIDNTDHNPEKTAQKVSELVGGSRF